MRYTFFCLQRIFLCYLLSYPTYMHILQGTLHTYQIIHTHLQGIFATYLNIHTYLQSIFATYLNIHTYFQGIFATYLNLHTYLQGILSTYLLHFEWHSFAICSHIFTFIWKAIPCHIFKFWEVFHAIFSLHVHFAKHLTTYSTYVRFIWKVFASCYLFYIYMYMVKNIFTPSKCKEIIMMQPKPSAGLKGKPHQHVLIFTPSCIQN